jgi:hypothetical protein
VQPVARDDAFNFNTAGTTYSSVGTDARWEVRLRGAHQKLTPSSNLSRFLKTLRLFRHHWFNFGSGMEQFFNDDAFDPSLPICGPRYVVFANFLVLFDRFGLVQASS